MTKDDRINRMIAWLENKIDKALDDAMEHGMTAVADPTYKMNVLMRLYVMQQASIRMARAQKLMDDARGKFVEDDSW